MSADEPGLTAEEQDEEQEAPPPKALPLGIVIARIVIVSGIGISAAFAIFFVIGAIWLPGLIAAVASVVFLVLMFTIERWAER